VDHAQTDERARDVIALYDAALSSVYGYLVRRCGSPTVAEDLTAETFLAAVDAARRPGGPGLTVGWLIGVARHKLADHWRRVEREARPVSVVAGTDDREPAPEDPFEPSLARRTLADLGPSHRHVLTLRYLDGLAPAEVAAVLGRTVGATEVLLVRARQAFRTRYHQLAGEGP
jgi:RNA polymerase sigma-70 factor, ECF subfamily